MIPAAWLLPDYINAEQLAACDLTNEDGLALDALGGITLPEFLNWFEAVSRQAAKIFTSENFG